MFLLYVCLNKDEKSIQVVIFILFFRFVSFLVRLCMGLHFFLFCFWFFGLSSWFVPLFGYPIYGRRVGGAGFCC